MCGQLHSWGLSHCSRIFHQVDEQRVKFYIQTYRDYEYDELHSTLTKVLTEPQHLLSLHLYTHEEFSYLAETMPKRPRVLYSAANDDERDEFDEKYEEVCATALMEHRCGFTIDVFHYDTDAPDGLFHTCTSGRDIFVPATYLITILERVASNIEFSLTFQAAQHYRAVYGQEYESHGYYHIQLIFGRQRHKYIERLLNYPMPGPMEQYDDVLLSTIIRLVKATESMPIVQTLMMNANMQRKFKTELSVIQESQWIALFAVTVRGQQYYLQNLPGTNFLLSVTFERIRSLILTIPNYEFTTTFVTYDSHGGLRNFLDHGFLMDSPGAFFINFKPKDVQSDED